MKCKMCGEDISKEKFKVYGPTCFKCGYVHVAKKKQKQPAVVEFDEFEFE